MLGLILRAARDKWLMCLTIALGCAAVALLLGFVMKPWYRVEAVLSPVMQTKGGGGLGDMLGQFGGLAALTGLNPQSGQARAEGIAILRSRTLIGSFIEDNQLRNLLTPYKPHWFSRHPPTLNDAIDRFSERVLTVKEDTKTGMVTVRIDWRDPQAAEAWCRGLVAKVNETIRNRDIAEAKLGIEYLNKQLEHTTQVGIQQAISHVLEDQLKVMTLANVRPEYAFKVIDPGTVPDLDKPVRPKKFLMTLAGFAFGALLAVLIAAIRAGVFSEGAPHVERRA